MEADMLGIPPLSALEEGLASARAAAAGAPAELAALVELAARLVRDPQRRGALAREGVALAERLGDDVARVHCQAMVLESVARRESAAEALPDALRTLADAERVADPRAIAQAHHTVAHCFDVQDCTPEALEHVHKALDGYRAGGDIFGEGRMLSFMAWLFWQLGEPERARPLYEQAHDIFLDCDDPSGAGMMLACVAGILCEGGAATEAAATCERALESFEQAGMPLDSVIAMREYANALCDLGQYDLAALWAKRALERNRMPDGTLANPEYEVDLLLVLARSVQLPVGELREAHATLERGLALATELGALSRAAEIEATLAEVLHTLGDSAAAYEHLLRSRKLTEKVTQYAHDQRVRALRVRFEVEQAQQEALRYRAQAQAQAEIIAELERTKAELARRMDELERLNDEVDQLSKTDPLTGIANRRRVNEKLTDLTRASTRFGTSLSVAVFDIDQFKVINDRYGHEAGDDVLVAFAELLRAHLRATDLPARLGGDEFVAIMPGATADEALPACHRILAAVRGYPWHMTVSGLAVTVTIGIADGTGLRDCDEILRQADAALYRGKNAGRNTVMV
jgi:diguanylate cyclase (GGDEF)-like protein